MFRRKKEFEAVVAQRLKGDAQKNALNLAAFMRANGISLEGNKNGNGWAVGGTVGNSIGYLMVDGSTEIPGPWTLWFNSCEFNCPADDIVKEAAWAHASPCGRCHAGWKDCGSGGRTIFGKEFESLCHSPLMFCNPDAKTLENMKKLMLMLKEV